MVLIQTPLRISFFGGGTDFPSFFRRYGGAVLSSTIDKSSYITIRDDLLFDESRTERVRSIVQDHGHVEAIEHPIVREALRYVGVRNIHLAYDTELPPGSGLGTSSALAVGVLQALYALRGHLPGCRKLANGANYIERQMCCEAGGLQDAIAVAYGGLNRIDFGRGGFTVNPVAMSMSRTTDLFRRLILVSTGVFRRSSSLQNVLESKMQEKKKELLELREMVKIAESILASDADLRDFGKLLHETWGIKRSLHPLVGNTNIDSIYSRAVCAGATGGKLLGAGGGGFFLFFVEPDRIKCVKKALSPLFSTNIAYEADGSRILFRSAPPP